MVMLNAYLPREIPLLNCLFLIQDPQKVKIWGEITAEKPHVIVFKQEKQEMPVYIKGKSHS